MPSRMGEGADKVSPVGSPRMRQLQKMLQSQPDDPFLLYGVAMEHKKAGDPGAALEFLRQVTARDPNYCYAYYQQGLVHESQGDKESARRAYLDGIQASERAGDAHAKGEIEAALEMLES